MSAQKPPAVAFTPFPGPQAKAYSVFPRELLYGGARGGGKTTIAVAKFLPYAAKFGDKAHGVVFRQSYPELERVQKEGVKLFVRTGWAEWRTKDNMFLFTNGASLKLRFLETYADCGKYQGHEYCYISFDEAGGFPDERMFEDMRACLRCPEIPDRYWHILYTANPGGPMHQYLRTRFGIDRWPKGNILLRDKHGRTRMFIPAKVTDNLALAGTAYEEELQSISDPVKRRAWLDGDWDVVAGAFFADCWSASRNLIDWKELPPRHWPIYRSMDWGSAEPFCVHWWTVTNDDVMWDNKFWPRGAIVVLREWYGNDPKAQSTNTGLRLLDEDLGRGIRDRELRWDIAHRVQPGPADTSIWTADGGMSHADAMQRGGGGEVVFIPAYKDRIVGWDALRTRLKGPRGQAPMLYLDRRCEASIRTIPVVQRSERDIEDLDTDQEDHAVDSLRYIVNQFIRPKTKKPHEPWRSRRDQRTPVLDDAFGY